MLSLEKAMPLIGLAPAKLSTFGDISALLSTPGASQLSAIGLDNNMYVLLNGCAGIPGLQCVGLPGGTLCCACYQGFPATAAPPQPCTAVATATIPTVTALTTGYPQQAIAQAALPQQQSSASFHSSVLTTVTGQLRNIDPSRAHLRPRYPHQTTSHPGRSNPGFNGNQNFRPGHNRLQIGYHPKGLKRKAEDTLSTDSNDSGNGKSECSTGSGEQPFLQPLYCKVCRVTLNAPAQAKQHYEGKSHAKKVKLTDCSSSSSSSNGTIGAVTTSSSSSSSSSNSTGSSSSSSKSITNGTSLTNSSSTTEQKAPSSAKEAPPPPPEINPEIYCKVCGVSFNSTKQAQQHYQGKNHAKKTRVTDGDKSRSSYRRGFRYRCFLCNIHLGSKEHLLIHLRGPRHQEKLKAQGGAGLGALGGQWSQHNKGIPNGVPFGITQISQGTSIRRSHGYNNTYHVGNTPSTMPKSRSDLSMHRTPSGKYYCPSCNMTVSSEALFTQHVESRKHKTISSPQRNNTSLDITNNNNNNNNNNMEQSPTHIT